MVIRSLLEVRIVNHHCRDDGGAQSGPRFPKTPPGWQALRLDHAVRIGTDGLAAFRGRAQRHSRGSLGTWQARLSRRAVRYHRKECRRRSARALCNAAREGPRRTRAARRNAGDLLAFGEMAGPNDDPRRRVRCRKTARGHQVQPPRANSKGFTRSALAASPRPSLATGGLGSFAGYARDPDAVISHRSALIARHPQPARSGPIQWQHRTPTLMGMLPQIWFLETSLSEWLAEQTL